MIRRDIVEHPERIESMDFFNDGEDTVRWLQRSPGTEHIVQRIREACAEHMTRKIQQIETLRTNFEQWG